MRARFFQISNPYLVAETLLTAAVLFLRAIAVLPNDIRTSLLLLALPPAVHLLALVALRRKLADELAYGMVLWFTFYQSLTPFLVGFLWHGLTYYTPVDADALQATLVNTLWLFGFVFALEATVASVFCFYWHVADTRN
jgi:F0F1-type ATP synthase membrane subunit c/vacuolar-type H+-ATPase subunit K